MRITLVTEAWFPRVNGAVKTLSNVKRELEDQGHIIDVISPDRFKSFLCPTYPEISLVLNPWKAKQYIEEFGPDSIHIATEGPLGLYVRRYCKMNGLEFTTSYHTKFPEYIKYRFKIVPLWPSYAYLRWFHNGSEACLVTTKSMENDLIDRGFNKTVVWGVRGVDLDLFHPNKAFHKRRALIPVLVYVGRASVEKNIEAFLDLDIISWKIVVGDGPHLEKLKKKYPDAIYMGMQHGEELATSFASADVFVFPSKSDTFGVVLIEASACGTPIAAYPVTGPIDIVENGVNGWVDVNLNVAVKKALTVDRESCRKSALKYTWKNCADVFLQNLKNA